MSANNFISFTFGSQPKAVERQKFKHKFPALKITADTNGGFFLQI